MKRILSVCAAILLVFLVYHFAFSAESPTPSSAIDQTIQLLEKQAISPEGNDQAKILLGEAYFQKVRETADVSYYAKIDELVAAIDEGGDTYLDAQLLASKVALGRHDFAHAKTIGEMLVAKEPKRASNWGILADALVELGEYERVQDALQQMVNLKPDFASYSRISYFRELYGDISGAKEAMRQAISIGGAFPENNAWAIVELGKLAFRSDLAEAKALFERALTYVPDYPPALEWLGRVKIAQGDLLAGEEYLLRASEVLPIADYATALGELYEIKGELLKSDQQYALASFAYDRSQTSGTNTDLEWAVFLADHDLDLPGALEKAARAFKARPSIYGADAYAWALFKNGKLADARAVLKQALRLGLHDPHLTYHASEIERAAGNALGADKLLRRTYELSPHFSILFAKR